MTYKRIIAMCASFAVLVMCWATAQGGDPADPVISLSYLEDTFTDEMLDRVAAKVSQKLSFPEERATEIFRNASAAISDEGISDAAVDVALEELQARGKFWYSAPSLETVSMKPGQVICGDAGTKVTIFSGRGVIYGNPVVDITAGYEYAAGAPVAVNNSYFFTENNGSGIHFTADSKVGVSGNYKILSYVRTPRYTELAKALKTMGLVRGAANGFELYRGATRAEAITMLVRLLAEESQANRGGLTHHFTDVDSWADNVVAYAFKKGYANGTSKTTFGASSPTTVDHYMTFLLRALGYDDAKGDFSWDSSMQAAVEYGVISEAECRFISSTPFTRDHMVYLSYYALITNMKNSDKTLLESLIERGAVSESDAEDAIASVTRTRE